MFCQYFLQYVIVQIHCHPYCHIFKCIYLLTSFRNIYCGIIYQITFILISSGILSENCLEIYVHYNIILCQCENIPVYVYLIPQIFYVSLKPYFFYSDLSENTTCIIVDQSLLVMVVQLILANIYISYCVSKLISAMCTVLVKFYGTLPVKHYSRLRCHFSI